jgi:hypothetical protein
MSLLESQSIGIKMILSSEGLHRWAELSQYRV